jgi:raffinose/stachyose/melibiose transport system substrate-binding protein
MDIQGQWYDGNITADEQDMSLYGTFAFPSGGTNRLSAFAEMVQFNAKNTEAEFEASMRYTQYYNSQENADLYPTGFNLPLPLIGATMPAGQPNVTIMMDTSNTNGTFTITDQAFPTEIADSLFAAQDAIATGTMEPADGAKSIQAAIEKYQAANK